LLISVGLLAMVAALALRRREARIV
jgi:hypothetical protein